MGNVLLRRERVKVDLRNKDKEKARKKTSETASSQSPRAVESSVATNQNNVAKTKPNGNSNKKVQFFPIKRHGVQGIKSENIVITDADQNRKLTDFYTLEKKLGEGSYGKVRLGKSKKDKSLVAIKSILKKKVRRAETLFREIGIMREMQHPNIVRLYDVFEDETHLHIVMELCLGGELFDHITTKKSFSEFEAAALMRQILDAVAYLHDRKIAHRDLKPENFLFKEKENPTVLKIIDFGLSRFYKQSETNMKTRVGTPYYIAPEVLAKNYDLSCDIWSVGVILYILLCGYPPFWGDTEKEIFGRIKKGELDFPEEEWDPISAEAKDLIRRMLTIDCRLRITAKEALHHPWLSSKQDKALHPDLINRLTTFSKQNKFKRIALGIIARWMNEHEIKNLRQQFEVIDEDGNGTISVSELAHAMRKVGLEPSNQEVANLLKCVDADGNGKLDYTEFIAATMEEHLYLKDEVLHKVFAYFDKDHTGTLTTKCLAETIGESDAVMLEKFVTSMGSDCTHGIDFETFKRLMSQPETPTNSEAVIDTNVIGQA